MAKDKKSGFILGAVVTVAAVGIANLFFKKTKIGRNLAEKAEDALYSAKEKIDGYVAGKKKETPSTENDDKKK